MQFAFYHPKKGGLMWIEIIEQRNMTLPIKTIGAQMNHCHFVTRTKGTIR
jgi:hypothetical protein